MLCNNCPCTFILIGVSNARSLHTDSSSFVRNLYAMTVAEGKLGPHYALELVRGHSRMQVWSSANFDVQRFAGNPGAVPQSVPVTQIYHLSSEGTRRYCSVVNICFPNLVRILPLDTSETIACVFLFGKLLQFSILILTVRPVLWRHLQGIDSYFKLSQLDEYRKAG